MGIILEKMIKELTTQAVKAHKNDYILVDVREADELTGPEGCIDGIQHVPLGPHLAAFLASADPESAYVFLCRSGVRSAKACEIAQLYGFQKAYNMTGGMLAWQAMESSEG